MPDPNPSACKLAYKNSKICAVLDLLSNFSKADFRDLALVAMDQADYSLAVQAKVEKLLTEAD